MFSARYFLNQLRPHFSRSVVLHLVIGGLLLGLLWSVSAMGPLRTFLPNTLQITGWPGTERTYLLVFQNNTELRPTGGFITAYALLTFKNGIPSAIHFEDVYGEIDDHPYIKPPYPLDLLLEKDSETYAGHSFRDANVSPNFLEAKDELVNFLHITRPEQRVDGVFAVNFSVLEDMVELYGPIKVDNQTLNRTNLFESLENAVSDIDRHNLEALGSRKNIIKDFAEGVVRKMVLSPWKWRELSEVITQNLNEKSILLAFENHWLAQKVTSMGWDGRLPEENTDSPTDRLIVNVANYGDMKSDRYITREVHYFVEITEQADKEGKPVLYGNLEVELRHRGDYNTPLSGGYKGYLRVLLPVGTELLESSTGQSTPEAFEGYAAWGDFLQMFPGESLTFNYRFKLNPLYYQDNDYNLKVIKQPGTKNNYYEIAVKSPLGRSLASNQFETHENLGLYRTTLDQDVELGVSVLLDTVGPRIFEQRFRALNVIEVSFGEALDEESALDPSHYEIIDLNKNIPEITDTISIDFLEVEGGTLRIHTKGIDFQPEEHFQIVLRNLRDFRGNLIRPNPRTITAVQRLE